MTRVLIILTIFVFLLVNISASCDKGQIDINTASIEELDQIIYIGVARAEQIIALRPFDSVDDMIRINGIGEVYLSAIKAQELACVDDIKEDEEPEEEIKIEENEEEAEEPLPKETTPLELQTINLNPQVIKTEENKKETSKNYALYGFVAFCIFIGILFLIKNRKYKNEFR
ncbi:MAG TPA: helix-hairpin-helix domain-containing protein [Bacillota bacterium]|nr:helix-hairpin-helix domain-containing protein [Bacillota bacterium]